MTNRYTIYFTNNTTHLVMADDSTDAINQAITETGKTANEVTRIERG